MVSIEQSVKRQFARVFPASDWRLFKEVAEIYLSEAAFLKKSALKIAENRKLLIRNSRKRLYIGLGAELLIKAIYLKAGYCINKPVDKRSPVKFPFTHAQAAGLPLCAGDTYTFDRLIGQLMKVLRVKNEDVVIRGLSIAKVFRNKEGHVVTRVHKFDPSSYRAIEEALRQIYATAFHEYLTVRFSFATKESGAWRVTR